MFTLGCWWGCGAGGRSASPLLCRVLWLRRSGGGRALGFAVALRARLRRCFGGLVHRCARVRWTYTFGCRHCFSRPSHLLKRSGVILILLGLAACSDTAVPAADDLVGPARLRLEPTPHVSFGGLDERPEYSFSMVSDGAFLDSDKFVILDSQNRDFKVYTTAGEHLRTFGREGDGPGEIGRLPTLLVSSDGSVRMWDGLQQRLTVFNDQGEHLESVRPLEGVEIRFAQVAGASSDNTVVWKRPSQTGGAEEAPTGAYRDTTFHIVRGLDGAVDTLAWTLGSRALQDRCQRAGSFHSRSSRARRVRCRRGRSADLRRFRRATLAIEESGRLRWPLLPLGDGTGACLSPGSRQPSETEWGSVAREAGERRPSAGRVRYSPTRRHRSGPRPGVPATFLSRSRQQPGRRPRATGHRSLRRI